MKYRCTLLIFLFLVSCTPRNPFYGMHLSEPPFLTIFEGGQEHPDYSITGEKNIGNNTFKCQVPDSLGGRSIAGDCVADILMDNKSGSIKQINVIGMYLYDSRQKQKRSFDIYYQGFKRVNKLDDKGFEGYISFVRNFVSKLSFQRLTKVNNAVSHVYCRILLSGSK